MPTITNFGDSVTQGFTSLLQNLTVQGATSTFWGNIYPRYEYTSIGNVANPFRTVYASSANATTVYTSFLSSLTNQIGVNTSTNIGSNLQIQGNLYASNAVQTTNIFAQSVNVAGTTSVTTLVALSNIGIGTAPVIGGPALYVVGNVYVSNAITTNNLFSVRANVSGIANFTSLVVTSNVGIGTTPVVGGPQLAIQGNLYASNAITSTNIFASLANVTSVINTASFIASSIGIGIAASGNALSVQGNVYISNSLLTTNITATGFVNTSVLNTAFIYSPTGFIGVNTTNAKGTSLYVNGNLYASNAISTTNIYSTGTINASFINATTMVATLQVTIGTLNATTLNTTAIYGTAGKVGINTSTNLGATLQIQGNLYASNTLTAPNLTASGTLYYNEDVTRRGPYLLPSQANAGIITAWISATCNAASQPSQSWWATSPNPVYGNAAAVQMGVVQACDGGVLLPDGRVIFTAGTAPNSLTLGAFNPYTGIYSNISPKGFNWNAVPGGSVLLPNGNVVFVPQTTANVGMYNPVSNVFSNIGPFVSLGKGHIGAVLAPDGNVICAPYNNSNIGVFNPTTSIWSNINVGTRLYGFGGAVLTPSGNVVFVPHNNSNIGVFNPSIVSTAGYSNVGPIFAQDTAASYGGVLTPSGNVVFPPWNSANIVMYNPTIMDATGISNCTSLNLPTNAFIGGVLLPSGNVVFAPSKSANIGMYSPITNKYSNAARVGDGPGSYFNGAVLVPDGRVIFIPAASGNVGVLNTMVPAPREFCLSPYFNKF